MPLSEIHKAIDELRWDEVEFLADKDPAIKMHIAKCTECRDRADKVNYGRLANLGAAKRRLIMSAGERLAALFLAKGARSN